MRGMIIIITKENIIDAFHRTLSANKDIATAIYQNNPIPEQIEDTLLALSSINFVDLLIGVEDYLGVEFAEDFMTMSKITIGELAEKIIDFSGNSE